MTDCINREAARGAMFSAYPLLQKDKLEDVINSIPAADVRPVVLCRDCKWWTKQEASLQGRCELWNMYPSGAWFCANGERQES